MADEPFWLWTDGGSRNNPGPAAAGIVIAQPRDQIVYQAGIFLADQLSNNQAEYQALCLGLTKVQALGGQTVVCHMDSQLVVEQVNGRYKVKDEGMKQRWEETRQLLKDFKQWEVRYLPRAENAEADRLVNQALDEWVQRKS